MVTRLTALFLLAFAAMAMPAYAQCSPSPDGPNSQNVQNGQDHTLCLNKQLNDTSSTMRDEARWNNLTTSIQRSEIQRRFDSLPSVSSGLDRTMR